MNAEYMEFLEMGNMKMSISQVDFAYRTGIKKLVGCD